MRKSIIKKSVAMGLSVIVATASFTGCGIFDKGKDEKTNVENAAEEKAETSIVDVLKEAQSIKNGELKGTMSLTSDGETKSYEYEALTDGNGGAQLKLSELGSDSQVVDVILYDGTLYVTADLSTFMMGASSGSGETQCISVNVNTLAESYGVDFNNFISTDSINEYSSLLTEVVEVLAKDMPSVFGKDIILDSANAEKTYEEFEVFAKNDVRGVLEKIEKFTSKLGAAEDSLGIDNAKLEKIEKDGFGEEDKKEIMNTLENTDAKVSADISGDEGSRVLDCTIKAKYSGEEDAMDFDMSCKFEEKTVDIKSLIPKDAISLDDYLGAMLGSDVTGIE